MEARVDLVVRLGPASTREREAVADLDALDRLDPHQREREPRVEPVGLLGVRPEPGWHARRDDLDDPAERVAVLPRRVGRLSHALVGRLPADLDRPPCDRDRRAREERLRDRARSDVDRRVPGRGPLERVADVLVAVLEDAREVGVAGPWQRHGLRALPGCSPSGGQGLIPHVQFAWSRFRTTSVRGVPSVAAVTEAREHLDLVGFELLARAAAVALLAAAEVGIDRRACRA